MEFVCCSSEAIDALATALSTSTDYTDLWLWHVLKTGISAHVNNLMAAREHEAVKEERKQRRTNLELQRLARAAGTNQDSDYMGIGADDGSGRVKRRRNASKAVDYTSKAFDQEMRNAINADKGDYW